MRPLAWLKALPLVGFSFVEIGVAFVRMIILTHILGPYEFGFSVAISAAYATIEQIADLAIYRFVASNPRSAYEEAIAGAHALNILRGFFLACGVLIVSYPLGCTLASCNDWPSFAWLAPVVLIRSCEHLEIRIRERDYRYWPQLTASIASHGAGLAAMTITAYETGSHYAFIAYLLVQAAIYVLASHLLAVSKYQVKLRTPYLQKAFAFGFPLMVNGIGLAVILQGDRLMVGALMGLPALGLYAVLILASTVPISGLFRILGPIQFAAFHNAPPESPAYGARIKLFSRALPMVAACYALGLVVFLKPIVPLIFGARYAISDPLPLLVGLVAFLRIARTEPHTSLLLQTQKTRKLAIASLSPGIGLLCATVLVLLHPSIESVLMGAIIGESIGLGVIFFMTRKILASAAAGYIVSVFAALAVVLLVYAAILITRSEDILFNRAVIAGGFFILILVGAAIFLPRPLRAAYGARAKS
jgi:O-antigen/teichoic acid export membrane protein